MCANSEGCSETAHRPSLFAYAISTKISCAGSNNDFDMGRAHRDDPSSKRFFFFYLFFFFSSLNKATLSPPISNLKLLVDTVECKAKKKKVVFTVTCLGKKMGRQVGIFFFFFFFFFFVVVFCLFCFLFNPNN